VPVVRIDLLGGRPPELLRSLIGSLHTAVVDTLGVPDDSVTIIVNEVAPELWGAAGATKAEQRAAQGSQAGPGRS
jgi:4-oxalocrotonate tautomerase